MSFLILFQTFRKVFKNAFKEFFPIIPSPERLGEEKKKKKLNRSESDKKMVTTSLSAFLLQCTTEAEKHIFFSLTI